MMNLAEKDKNTAAEAAEPTAPETEPAAQAKPEKAEKAEKAEKKKNKDKKEMEALAADLKAMEEQLAQQKDLLLRTAAEFDNYKRRTEKEKQAVGEFVKAQTLKAFLPTLDNIDRAKAAEGQAPEEYAKGVQMILRQFAEAVEKSGLIEIEAAGQPFDPNMHEAVMHVEDGEAGENIVLEVLQKGYKVGDTVVRPAMVKVAN